MTRWTSPQVQGTSIGLVSEAARRLRLSPGVSELRDIAGEIEWAKVSQVRPDEYEQQSSKSGRTGPLTPASVATIYAGYEELRRERNLVDFESVLELTSALLADHPVAAAAEISGPGCSPSRRNRIFMRLPPFPPAWRRRTASAPKPRHNGLKPTVITTPISTGRPATSIAPMSNAHGHSRKRWPRSRDSIRRMRSTSGI